MSNLVLNGGFSNPDVNGYTDKLLEMTSSTLPYWTFNNTSQPGIGIYVARNGGFFIPANTDGYTQVMVLQLRSANSWTNTGVNQTITFPYYGNYVLSFWVAKRTAYATDLTSQTITVSIGSYSQVCNSSGPWVKFNIPFTVFSNTLTLDIRTQSSITYSGGQDNSMYITGLIITISSGVYSSTPLLLNSASSGTGSYDAVLMSDMVPTVDTANTKVGSSSLAFNATYSQYSQMLNFSVPTTGLSIACWFKVSSVGNSRVFDFGNGQGNDNIAYSPNSGTVYYIGTTAYNIAAASGKADNTWHHFVWTMSFAPPYSKTSTHTVYIDNVAVYTSTAQYYPTVGERTNSYLGRSNWSSDVYTTGNIDDFRTYNSVLSANDITILYFTNSTSTNGKMNYNLTKYYPFETPSFEWITNGYFTTSPVYGQNIEPYGWKAYAGVSGTDISGYFGIANTTTWTTNNINAAVYTATPLPTGVSNFVWLLCADTHITPGIYQDISFSSVGNYTLSFWASTTWSGTNTTLYIKTGSNTQTVSVIMDIWTKYTVSFNVSSITSATRLNLYTNNQANSTTFLSAISVIYASASSSTNTLLGTSVGNLATGNLVYDATLYGGASIVYDNYKVGTSCLAINASLGNQYVQIQNFSVTNQGLTIACWFKYTSTGWSRLFDFGNGQASDNIIYSPQNGTSLYVGATDQGISTGSGKADGNWHHFVWTMTYASGATSTHTIYIDNSSTIITGKNYPTLGARTNCYIGRSNWGADPYAKGFVDDFRIYNGVLSANDVGLLYNSVSSISFSGNYTLGSANTTLTTVYDASLNGGAYISTTNYIVGTGALTMDTSGQYVKLNNSLTTGSTLSFAFWMRGNNGVGQYTLLDYSNGAGGKNRISLGLQNNTLYSNVVNGTTIGTVSFTTAQTSTVPSGAITGVAYSTSADRFVFTDYTLGTLYFRTGIAGTNTSFATGYIYVVAVCITSDGSRVVWSLRGGNCYYATWDGTTYSGINTINLSGSAGVQGIDMTDDGKILVVAVGYFASGGAQGVPLWAYWTGSGYSTYRSILGATIANNSSIAITPDGNRIGFADLSNNVYYSTWNGTNYSNTTLITNVGSNVYCMKFSKDGNILFLNINAVNTLRYFIWNGSSFGSIQSNTVFNSIYSYPYGLCVDYNNTMYGCAYSVSTLYKTTFQVSNQYTASNFYYEQNLNDNVWRHVAWTIDVSNSTYKYYINGSLVKTDTSSNYAFPAPVTRTKNLLATGTDLSLSYFTGGIDDYRVYNSVLTDAQVSDIYSGKVFGGSPSITELKNVFKPYSKGIQPVVDLNYLGNETATIFQPYTSGVKASATGVYVSRGGILTDLCNLYQPIQNSFIFTYTGSNQTFIVPTGTTTVKIECWGAGGGTQGGGIISAKHTGNGGGGGYTKALFSIKAGTSLTVIVGEGGKTNNTGVASSYTYGGGGGQLGGDTNWGSASGGGRSAVRITSSSVEIITAGGGGGAGCIMNTVSTGLSAGNGGGGGGSVGGNALSAFSNDGGKGGTQTAGGAVATNRTGTTGSAGSQYTGGGGASYGAGGGGGYYGGGAGGIYDTTGTMNNWSFGGGGGGSSYIHTGFVYSGISSTSMIQATAPTVANGSGLPTAYINTIGNGGSATNYIGTGSGGSVGQNGLIIITCN